MCNEPLWLEVLFRVTEGMLNRDKIPFHSAVFVLIQIKHDSGLEDREYEQQSRWNAEKSQKEPEMMPGTGNL